ncbi:MAG: alpha/beta hydrolase family protein [Candidatus Xenobia bacterium]
MQLITPHTGDAKWTDCRFTPHGLLLLTNRDRETMGLAYLDLPSGQLQYRQQGRWDAVAYLRSGTTRVMKYNVDGASQLRINGQVVDLPQGVINHLHFTHDGASLLFTLSGPQSPPNLWKLDLDSRQASPVLTPAPGIDPSTLTAPQLVHYTSFDGKQIPAFLYRPHGLSSTPAVVYVHGGPESQTRADFSPWIQYLVHHGYAVLAPNIRGSAGYGKSYLHADDVAKRPDAIEDVNRAGQWLKQSGFVNPSQVAVMGGSYGGYMTLAQLAFHPETWAAGVEVVGMSNLRTFLEHTGPWRRSLREAEYGQLGKDDAVLQQLSPITHAAAIQAPLLAIQGANDPRVPAEEADQIVRQIRQQGGTAEYLLFPDEGHGIKKPDNRVKAYTEAAAFLDRQFRS